MQASYESLESRILKGGVSQFAISRAGFWLREMDEAGNHSMMHAERTGQGEVVLESAALLLFPRRGPVPRARRCARSAARARALAARRRFYWDQKEGSRPFDRMQVPPR